MPRIQRGLIHRGEVWDADIPGVGRHRVVVASRQEAIGILSSLVCVLVTSRFHGHVAEVELNADEGLSHDSALNCDNVFTLPKTMLKRRRGRLGPAKLRQFDQALAIALGLR